MSEKSPPISNANADRVRKMLFDGYEGGHVMIVRDEGDQCDYCGVNEWFKAAENGVPTHVHEDENGRRTVAWGPADKCEHGPPPEPRGNWS